MHFPYLTVLVLLPGIAAAVVAAIPDAQGHVARALALLASGATFVVALVMGAVFKVGPGGFQLVSDHRWIAAFGISWHLGIDGISLFLVLMTALLFPLAMAGVFEKRQQSSFLAWMLLLEAACIGSFVSLDLFLFFVFFELTLVPSYFIIGRWGSTKGGPAATKFFLYTLLGSAFLFVGILSAVFVNQQATGRLTFSLPVLAASHSFGGTSALVLFLAFTAAFVVKAPVFPFHTWSPDAYSESPIAGVVVIAGVMAKLGSYGILRFDFELFPKASMYFAPLLLTLSVIGILYGSIVAARQKDLKRMMAYSSLAHLGFIVLGIFALTSQSVSGGVLQMMNHGLFTAVLFLVIGMVYARRHTWQTDELSGLQRSAPIMAGAFTVAMLASIGLPGLNGFVGEFLILIGTFITHRWWAVAATTGVVFSALYLLWAYQQVFHGKPLEQSRSMRDLTWSERAILAPLLILIVGIGVYPKPLLQRITPSVDSLMVHIQRSTSYVQPVVARTAKASTARGGK